MDFHVPPQYVWSAWLHCMLGLSLAKRSVITLWQWYESILLNDRYSDLAISRIYPIHCDWIMGGSLIQTPLDELASFATTCHCERESKCNGTPAAACEGESGPWPSRRENGIRAFGQEKRQRHSVATISHQVQHIGNEACYKCASHDVLAILRPGAAPPA